MTSLFKLLGAVAVLPVEKVRNVPVNQVKGLKDKLLKGIRKIDGLEFAKGRGKGWSWKGQRISPHELDAWLVYFLGKKDLEDTEWYEPHCEYCNELNCVCPTICRELCENCGEEQCFCEPEPEEVDHE